MFTKINCSGLKDSRFNEQLLLAGLKTLGRDSEGDKTERQDLQIRQNIYRHGGHGGLIFLQHLFLEL